MTENVTTHPTRHAADESVGALVAQLSEQTSRLIRDEIQLARAEMTEKGKKTGLGFGMFGGAGLFSLYGLACFIAAAILGIALRLPAWAAALIVGGALFAVAGLAALIGRREVSRAAPPMPTEAIDGVKQDIAAFKGGNHR